MKNVLYSGVALAALVVMSNQAAAQCLPDSGIDHGDTITCSGTDADGFDSGKRDLDITVNTGAVVNGDDGIKVRDSGNEVTNNGTIDVEDDGIEIGDNGTVINNGSIRSEDKGIAGREEDEVDVPDGSGGFEEERIRSVGVTVTNALGAEIVAEDDGIDSGGDLSVTNHGLIQADGKGIQAQDEFGDEQKVTVINTGTITAFDEAIEGGDDSEVTNSGTITSTVEDAVNLGENALITNAVSGVIQSLGGAQDAIDIDSGTIINEGTIASATDAAIDYDGSSIDSYVFNSGGTISALTVGIQVEKVDGPNTAAQIIENSGLIEGGLLSLDLGAGEDMYTHLAGGELVGDAMFGDDNDTFIFKDMIEGISGWLDGGLGLDTMSFETYDVFDVTAVSTGAEGSTLFFGDAFVLARSWEVFQFKDGSYSLADLENATTAVPLPAGVWGLLTALGLLGWVRRRRAA